MKKILLLAFCVCVHGVMSAQLPTSVQGRLQDTLNVLYNQYNFKGLSVAVSYKNLGVWKAAVGVSAAQTALSPDHLIGIGSNTKTFISTLLLKLSEHNQIDLNDTIGAWVSGYPNINGAVTIKQLLNHTSGIADYLDNSIIMDSLIFNPDKFWQREELLHLTPVPYFNPGASIEYSNTNYLIAGYIAEQVAGRPIQELLRDSIYAPAGLHHSYFPPFESVADEYASFWTDLDGDNKLDDGMNWNQPGSILPVNINTIARDAGAIVATAQDVVLFWRALLEGNIIATQTLNTVMFQASGFGNQNSDYGMGIFMEKYRGNRTFSHGGTWIGQINSNMNDTLNDIYIAVLSNQDSLDNDYTQHVVEALYDVLYNEQATSVAELKYRKEVFIFPNPTSGDVTIDGLKSKETIYIHDMMGKQLKVIKCNAPQMSIPFQEFTNGVYFLQVIGADGVIYTDKIIKQ